MTKSEATAINQCVTRAIRALLGTSTDPNGISRIGLTSTQSAAVWEALKPAHDEIQRVAEMARAELGK